MQGLTYSRQISNGKILIHLKQPDEQNYEQSIRMASMKKEQCDSTDTVTNL